MVSLQKADSLPKESLTNLGSAVEEEGTVVSIFRLPSILVAATATGPWQTPSRGSCRQPVCWGGWGSRRREASSGTEGQRGASGTLPGGGGFAAEKGRTLNSRAAAGWRSYCASFLQEPPAQAPPRLQGCAGPSPSQLGSRLWWLGPSATEPPGRCCPSQQRGLGRDGRAGSAGARAGGPACLPRPAFWLTSREGQG